MVRQGPSIRFKRVLFGSVDSLIPGSLMSQRGTIGSAPADGYPFRVVSGVAPFRGRSTAFAALTSAPSRIANAEAYR